MQDNDRLGRGIVKILHHSFPSNCLGLVVPISILPKLSVPRILKDESVITPSRVRVVNSIGPQDSLQELSAIS